MSMPRKLAGTLNRKPRIGLALGSGSSRGWAHIGAIRALEERGIKFDLICGTSVGALVGAVHASGQLNELEEWVTSLVWRKDWRLMDFSRKGGLIRGPRLRNPSGATFRFLKTGEPATRCGVVAT